MDQWPPGGAVWVQVSRAKSRTRTSGESSSLAIHAGTTKGSSVSVDLEEETDTVLGLSPPGTSPRS